ncbi:dTDP-4-dehydrorhamnose 3,5-epimerase [Amylibacter kogurei]|uniref:dTDP-4-dehydrorhamnose 3,5-epimerase n=1 Tax=Paramylibacter kogurei TaxID=1889778 RepID=A0A2G5KB60_9RHOB|nr:dTDP-4-dehydrorhamnose 3,5-epimerase [Amylibacter kogurei]PIB26758.1 dTDP-4-dehydrorhamnose 3,5-epimerase [Amylibacter kogurei]
MQVEETEIDGVVALTPRRFADDRGWFSETWNQRTLMDAGLDIEFVQDNHSFSAPKHTVRGLHYQSPPAAQGKLVRVLRGEIFDVAVDVRKSSPTFGKWVGVNLSAENGKQLYIPTGFLHGFVTLVENTEVAYKCTDFYTPECDGGVAFDDPDLAIDWGIPKNSAVLSTKDAAAPRFADFNSPFA